LANYALMETNYEGSRVIVSNVSLNQALVTFATTNTTLLMTNSSLLTMQLFNSAGATDSQGQLIPAFAYSVTGVVLQNKFSAPYTGFYQIALNLYSDINVTPPAGPPVMNVATSGSTLTLTWTGSPVLQSSTNVAGPYVAVPGATSPFVTNGAASSVPAQFFRLYQP